MASGGPRVGKQGRSYPNRRDLQLAPRAAPGQTYGEAKSQLDAQRAQPIAAPPSPPVSPTGPGPAPSTVPLPGSLPRLDRPSERPDVPVTAGADAGPGPGMEALAPSAAIPTPADRLRALYQRFPSEDLRELIEDDDEGGF